MADWEVIIIRGQRFAVEQCGVCGVLYVVPLVVHQHHFDAGGFAHCSNGHSWGWKEGNRDHDAVRRERDNLKQQLARLEDEKRAAMVAAQDELKRRLAAEKKLTATQARIGAGVCPCCNRTFAQLARHMQSKHPEVGFVPAAAAKKAAV